MEAETHMHEPDLDVTFTITESALFAPSRNAVIGMGGVGLALLALMVETVWTHPKALSNIGIIASIAASLSFVLASYWFATKGPLGPSPLSIVMSSTALGFKYRNGELLNLEWSSPGFNVSVKDVYGSWERNNPTLKTHKYWLCPPRGASVAISELIFRDLLKRSHEKGLEVTRREYGGSAYNKRHGITRTAYRITRS
jgi:hypothetical protein